MKFPWGWSRRQQNENRLGCFPPNPLYTCLPTSIRYALNPRLYWPREREKKSSRNLLTTHATHHPAKWTPWCWYNPLFIPFESGCAVRQRLRGSHMPDTDPRGVTRKPPTFYFYLLRPWNLLHLLRPWHLPPWYISAASIVTRVLVLLQCTNHCERDLFSRICIDRTLNFS